MSRGCSETVRPDDAREERVMRRAEVPGGVKRWRGPPVVPDATGQPRDRALLDERCTTGTRCSTRLEFVGRIAGDDVGYVGVTGAEARAWAAQATADQSPRPAP
ncbi:hypothetical protein E1298_17780 [Actinomadura rubrisoli]|uniref:Uncharacterized protein n=1 Tax=Actinomadura rubrisoli TaxID=2530368 RepID=A0A4R5BLG5_9ACTN|nr:hypothetical protein E1298_17780 [Actinomadura rubrisoli]